MNTFETDSTGKLRIDERLIVSAGILITSAMMACVAASFVQMGELAATGWRGSYLILLSFLVALEAIYSQRLLYHFYFTDPKLVIYRLTEWVVIIVVLKISQLLNRGVENLLVELAGWQKDFVSDFFTDETIFGLVVLIIVWYFSGRFAHELIPLDADQRV